jgi:hypothetical protein
MIATLIVILLPAVVGGWTCLRALREWLGAARG